MEEFIKTFVVADHFQLDSLLYGNNCFITGFKGTGKTALLFYLDNKLKDEDPITCTSFIFFKEEFTDAKRDELQAISNRFLSSISVEPGALLNIREFEYIWRWLIFKRIVSDNEDNHRNLFVDDEFWGEFERKVNQIKAPLNKKKSIIPSKIKIAVPYKDPATLTELSPEVEVDLGNNKGAPYQSFMLLIDEAEAALAKVNRTDNLSDVFGDSDQTNKFVTRYLQSTHCDLFFADAAILVEGVAESMLLPHFIRSKFPELYQRYITILGVNGRHAHRLSPLIEKLCLPTLVITDLDPAEKEGYHKSVVLKRGEGQISGNYAIAKWLMKEKDIDKLVDYSEDKKEFSFASPYRFSIRLAYQTPVKVDFESLAIIAYTYDCEAVKATAMKNNWFEDDEIRLLE